MECRDVQNKIADFLTGAQDNSDEALEIKTHLSECPVCRREYSCLKEAWDMLDAWPDEEPSRFYLSGFWTRLSLDRPWHQRCLEAVRAFIPDVRTAFLGLSVCVLLIAGGVTLDMSVRVNRVESLLTALSVEEMEFVQNLDLAEQIDLLEQMDLFSDDDGLGRAPEAGERTHVS